ncbi:MAG: type IV pilus assembly protein PilM [Candidatus Alcyoniella australis]|nr:type IV pilus assembly protein PilM [Candidatus Alcyoniella australis]
MFSRGKSILGLDIGSSSVKALELKEAKGGLQLASFGIEPLAPETIVDSTVMNAPAVVQAIRRVIQANNIKTKEVATSVSGHSVIIRKITLPMMTEEEVASNIQWEAEQYIPFDINEVHIDFQILEPMSDDQESLDVLLVAVKKDMVNDYVAVIRESGLNPVIMDVDAFAVQNMYEVNYEVQKGKLISIVNIGASVININIVRGTNSVFTRDISLGGNQFTEEIQKQMSVSFEDADKIKCGAGSPEQLEKAASIIQNVGNSVALETQRSLDFFTSTTSLGHISKVYLCGGSAKAVGLSKIIENQIGIPVELSNPFNTIEINAKIFDKEFIEANAPLAGVAVGLALRRSGDK